MTPKSLQSRLKIAKIAKFGSTETEYNVRNDIGPGVETQQEKREVAQLRVLSQAAPWPIERPLRAGVSAMGFGGINAHLVLEGRRFESSSIRSISTLDQTLSTSAQDAELFLFDSHHTTQLREQIEHLLTIAPCISLAEMSDLAAELQRRLSGQDVRAAIVASTPTELTGNLETLRDWLITGVHDKQNLRRGIFLGTGTNSPRLGFLFPGQGTVVYKDGGAMARRFSFAQDLYNHMGTLPTLTKNGRSNGLSGNGSSLTATATAQPAIVMASLAALRILNRLELKASVAVGHSLGELSALHWAGAMDEETLLRVATARGQVMTESVSRKGTMAFIGANHNIVTGLVNGDPVNIACFNSPSRTIIAGDTQAIAEVIGRARVQGLNADNIPVSHAFHSPLMAASVQPLAAYLATEELGPLRAPVVSTVTGDFLSPKTDLHLLLQRQVTEPVRFTDAVTKVAEQCDLLIEVGPGSVLGGLARECVETPVISIDAGGSSLRGLLQAIAAAYTLGAPLNHNAFFADRFTRPFDLNWQPRFFVNPCELAPRSNVEASNRSVTEDSDLDTSLYTALKELNTGESVQLRHVDDSPEDEEASSRVIEKSDKQNRNALMVVRSLVAERAELPIEAIRDDDRLLSDLHLNSITVSQLVIEAARRLNLAPPVAPTEYANVTVSTVAQTLEELAQTGGVTAFDEERRLVSGVDSWVRAFTVELVERPLDSSVDASASPFMMDRSLEASVDTMMAQNNWHIVAEADHSQMTFLQKAFDRIPGSGVVVCLPPRPDETHVALLLDGVRLLKTLERDQADVLAHDRCFVLVQHEGGAAALARTLHLEMPHIKTCVVDVPSEYAEAVDWIVDEVRALVTDTSYLTRNSYVEAHYNRYGRRYEPILRLLPSDTSDSLKSECLPLCADDVLLITGGGKGITAECALAVARQTGARLALMGRSRPDEDAKLALNLERMRAAGINFRYLVADVSDAQAVRDAVQEIERTLGSITGVLHGAARNVPQLLDTLDEKAFRQTLAPKLGGAQHLLQAINPDQLRLFVTFGSIIARTGLPGEADYGVANEWLTRLTEAVQHDHPRCRCLAIEWSVWAGAGMGDRLSRLDALVQQGIMPIPLDQGVEMFLRLLAQTKHGETAMLPTAVVVAGRFGTPPTLQLTQSDLPFWRFLEEIRIHYPGVELVVDATLSLETDPYLDDHVFRGERLLPAVVGLEAMAQTVMALCESDQPPIFEDVALERPIVVPNGASVTIRIAALVRTLHQIDVVVRSEESGFQADHFRATCRVSKYDSRDNRIQIDAGGHSPEKKCQTRVYSRGVAQSLSISLENRTQINIDGRGSEEDAVSLDPDQELYGQLFFHKGRFQRVRRYLQLSAKECIAEISMDNASTWFGRFLPADLMLGDPGARDAMIHAIQVCVPQATLLPIGIERMIPSTINGAENDAKSRLVHARERQRIGDMFTYDVDIVDADGRLVEQWKGLRLRMVNRSESTKTWQPTLLGSYLERELEELWPDTRLSIYADYDAAITRRVRSDRTIQTVLDQHATVLRRPDGCPEIIVQSERQSSQRTTVSVSHTQLLTLAVAGEVPLGSDLERIMSRPQTLWRSLLGPERWALVGLVAQETGENLDCSATRVWSALESIKKAGASLDAPLILAESNVAGWVTFASGTLRVATHLTRVEGIPEQIVVTIASGR